jgi:hypothetical protein
MSTRFVGSNTLVGITVTGSGQHFGFGTNGGQGAAEVSLGPRIIAAANIAAVQGLTTAPQGSLALLSNGTMAVNTDGATTWVLFTASSNSLATVIADPGNGGAIAVAASGTCRLVSGGAETRTLAIPTFIGQVIVLTFETDGGDIVATAASAINVAGNTKMTFGDIGDTITLFGAIRGGTRQWSVQGNDGVALS